MPAYAPPSYMSPYGLSASPQSDLAYAQLQQQMARTQALIQQVRKNRVLFLSLLYISFLSWVAVEVFFSRFFLSSDLPLFCIFCCSLPEC